MDQRGGEGPRPWNAQDMRELVEYYEDLIIVATFVFKSYLLQQILHKSFNMPQLTTYHKEKIIIQIFIIFRTLNDIQAFLI